MRRRATRIGKMIVVGHLFADDIGHLARRVMQANIVGARAVRIGVKLGNAVFVIIVALASGGVRLAETGLAVGKGPERRVSLPKR